MSEEEKWFVIIPFLWGVRHYSLQESINLIQFAWCFLAWRQVPFKKKTLLHSWHLSTPMMPGASLPVSWACREAATFDRNWNPSTMVVGLNWDWQVSNILHTSWWELCCPLDMNQLCVSHLPHPWQLEVVFELLLPLPQVSQSNDRNDSQHKDSETSGWG